MPELPEVETTRRGLLKAAKGQRITGVNLRRKDLRVPLPKNLPEALIGRTIIDIHRRAKYLLMVLDSGQMLLVHLGMSGSMIVVKSVGYTHKTHDHVLISLENGTLIAFHDPRRFGLMLLLNSGEEHSSKWLKNLGPEPFSEEFSPDYLSIQLKRRKGPIKPVLMDQKLVVGVGNIYASEALHLCGFNPNLPAHKLAPHAGRIITAIRTTLQAAIDSGGSTLRDYVGAASQGGYFQHQFKVYGRDGEACFACTTMIKTAVHAGRATYWCPQCQQIRAKKQKT